MPAEVSRKIPKQLEQVRKAISTIREVRSLHEKLGSVQYAALIGFNIFTPESVDASGILRDQQKRDLTRKAIRYFVSLNERLDLSHSPRQDVKPYFQRAQTNEEARARELQETIENAPEEIRDGLRAVIARTTQEIEALEAAVKQRKDAATSMVFFEDAVTYKELSNAIHSCAVTSIMFGQEILADKLQAPGSDQEITLEFLQDRYSWLTNMRDSQQLTNFERALGIGWLFTMIGQIEDDRNEKTDIALLIPSFSNAEETSNRLLTEKRLDYERRAKGLGLSPFGDFAIVYFQKFVQSLKRLAINSFARYSQLDGQRLNHIFSLREQWYIEENRSHRRGR
jgi:hypothetical protein